MELRDWKMMRGGMKRVVAFTVSPIFFFFFLDLFKNQIVCSAKVLRSGDSFSL